MNPGIVGACTGYSVFITTSGFIDLFARIPPRLRAVRPVAAAGHCAAAAAPVPPDFTADLRAADAARHDLAASRHPVAARDLRRRHRFLLLRPHGDRRARVDRRANAAGGWLAVAAGVIAAFEALTVLVLRAHYTMDVLTAVVAAFCAEGLASRLCVGF